ncbi:MAG TPA: hypothetical protein VFV52_02800 [Bacilli bacterium]|nr:hypothetical protein [Bacilli bacterium]
MKRKRKMKSSHKPRKHRNSCKKRPVRIKKRIRRGAGTINLQIDINVENLLKEKENLSDRNTNSFGNGGGGGGGGIGGGGGGGA